MRLPKLLRKLSGSSVGLLAFALIITGGLAAHVVWRGPEAYPRDPVWPIPEADPIRGRDLFVSYGCTGCHVIDRLYAPGGRVGPTLVDLKEQVYVGGVLPNTPENLIAWIRSPQEFSPRTAMPDLGVTEQDASDMAAFLYERPPVPKAGP